MVSTVGYLITLTMYGTWLQGEEKGFIKDGKVRGENPALRTTNIANLKGNILKLNRKQREAVREAIIDEAKRIGHKILAIAVCSNHVHIAGEYIDLPIGGVVAYYKNAGRMELKKFGIEGKVWTSGYDKRFCFDVKSLQARIEYVRRHGE